MGNVLEFFVKMKDMMSGGLVKIQDNVKRVASEMSNLQAKSEGLGSKLLGGAGKLLGTVGLFAAGFSGFEMIKGGIEKVHELHQAEAQLSNTMKNMGTYTDESFEKVIDNATNLSKGIGFTRAEIIGLESQLRLVGNIGEGEMARLTRASADMATKYHMGLEEAGNAIAKAVNNPEMLRRLAMQLKIDPAIVDHLEKIAKHGKEAQARLELLAIVEQKVGGAAKAAFDADPLAKWKKVIESVKYTLGGWAMSLLNIAVGTKTVSQSLMEEKAGVGALISMITKYNEGNEFRKDLLGDLVQQYPELFKNLDIEKVKNSELLSTLSKINDEYDRKINLATSDELINMYKSEGDKALKETKRWMAMHELAMKPDKASHQLAMSMLSWDEKYLSFKGLSDMRAYNPETTWGANLHDVQHYKNLAETEKKKRDFNEGLNAIETLYNRIQIKDTKGLDKGLIKEILDLYPAVGMERSGATTGLHSYDFSRMLTAAGITTNAKKTNPAGTDDGKVASGITGGGPRVININGVNMKLADKIEVKTTDNAKSFLKELEPEMEDLFLRILNSGASVQ